MSESRAAILGRLRAVPAQAVARPDWAPPQFGSERLARFCTMLEASHAELHHTTERDWRDTLRTVLEAKGVDTLMAPPDLDLDPVRVVGYDRPVEDVKDVLVHGVAAALTDAVAGIAETGTLVLWPDPAQPRLMSLLPPIHVALVRAATIGDTLAQIMARDGWAGRMPTNIVLVSGPSKTADIEQTLAYGVHGPKELVVLVIGDGENANA